MRSGELDMGLTKYKLGDLIELVLDTNSDLKYGPDDVRGMTITKEIIPTKANLSGTDLSKFIVVSPEEFIYNPRTHGKKIGFGYNNTNSHFIISWNNIAFRVKEKMKKSVVPYYLFLHFKRDEWDREACYQSWGTSTEVFTWDALCDMTLDLPSVEIQQKYVDVYNAMLFNQQSYERGLEDLRLTIDAIIDKFKNKEQRIPIHSLLQEVDQRNIDSQIHDIFGITMSKEFIPSVANLEGVDLTRYKIVKPGQIALNLMHVGRDKSLPIAINKTDCTIGVSPAYFVFDLKCEETQCIPEYMVMWLSREESGRYCWFISDTSVRGGFSLEQFKCIEIPVPNIETQRDLVEIYHAYTIRKNLNEQLKAQINDLCPILIKGSIEEGRKEA